ncbi:MAG: Peptide chain release factor 2 [Candidatus Anoxychlamydiales bacterium]|nr:Peptide chain release factor 2 [Candidatus Anoxychlamydiales bacterium]
MAIKKEKKDKLNEKMKKLNILEKDIIEKFILGSGRGGQKIQKTHSCVYLKHIPTGIEVKCQRERSRELNRYYARKELIKKFERLYFKKESEEQKKIYKLKKQKKKRSKRTKEKILKEKKIQSSKKELRKKVKEND